MCRVEEPYYNDVALCWAVGIDVHGVEVCGVAGADQIINPGSKS